MSHKPYLPACFLLFFLFLRTPNHSLQHYCAQGGKGGKGFIPYSSWGTGERVNGGCPMYVCGEFPDNDARSHV
ncbi:hypothetical protein GGR50DRAFT_674865 [Xylaria sp. CBS 124048]|nr:hypothetical protein GGR50DRAFT_674865 [Xylaria sp. CBS 124048]